MILIADSGSTKTDWVLLDKKSRFTYKTIGYNPYFTNSENIYQSVSEKMNSLFDTSRVKKVYFYGAGCMEEDKTAIVNRALTRCFINADVKVGHDMLAAARALLGNKRGFAAIIGTGSNTCLYDGSKVEMNIDSLGYLLGDEGSGSYIGKKIVKDYMRGYLPEELNKNFYQMYKLSNPDIFDHIYNKQLPNRFLANFCMFADAHQKHPYIHNIVKESFDDFFKNLVVRYPDYSEYEFNCIGSVGYIFREILKEVCEAKNMKVGKIIHTPIDELVNYHLTYP
jgi:glucosamine kinase